MCISRMFFLTLLLVSFMSNAIAIAPLKNRKFDNPAKKFEGTWRVESYDLREFLTPPATLAAQLREEAAGLPIGQRLRFKHSGSAVLPGSINPISMRSEGPVGETLIFTLLTPFDTELCMHEIWSTACGQNRNLDKVNEVMIDDIYDWRQTILPAYVDVWTDLQPLEYSLLDMGKSYHFPVRVGKTGDLFFMVSLEGHVKGRGGRPDSDGIAKVGVHLKLVSK